MKPSVCLFGALLIGSSLSAQDFNTLYNFSCSPESNCEPQSSLTEGAPGLFYGTSFSVLFTITPSGFFNQLFYFGENGPTGPAGWQVGTGVLFAGNDGYLYGNSEGGGSLSNGEIYKSDLAGNITPIAGTDYDPSPVVEGIDGNYYGVQGNLTTPCSFFRLTPDGVFTTLFTFPQNAKWNGPLLLATDGNFYGVTPPNISGVAGVIYRLTPEGEYTVMHTFNVNEGGSNNLMQASNGLIYGYSVGDACDSSDHGGGFFTMSLTGDFRKIHESVGCTSSFDSGPVSGFTECSNGYIYGTTGNTIFAMALDGTQYTTIENFAAYGTLAGLSPSAYGPAVIQGSDGNLYGTTIGGGLYEYGVVYQLILGLPLPLPRVGLFQPKSGMPGTTVRIKGSHLVGLSAVSFNGVPAKFESRGNDYAVAIVPGNATSGPITVTTMNGSGNSKTAFQIQ